jgi:aryl carrier-like protein
VPGDRRLVGYLVPAEGAEVETHALRAHLLERLPDYMVPSAFVQLESIPRSSTGKTDRRALPAPERGEARAYVAPRTAVETLVAQVWAEVLEVERVGVHDSFFDLGGHSLLAMRVSARLKEMKLDVPVRLLFQAPVLETLVRETVAREPRPGITEKVAAAVLKLRSLDPAARERMLQGKTEPPAGG